MSRFFPRLRFSALPVTVFRALHKNEPKFELTQLSVHWRSYDTPKNA
jgi:hypothetical protein